MGAIDLPLYIDGSSGCIQVGDRDHDISELHIDGLPPQPKGQEEMPTDDETEVDSDSSAESHDDQLVNEVEDAS